MPQHVVLTDAESAQRLAEFQDQQEVAMTDLLQGLLNQQTPPPHQVELALVMLTRLERMSARVEFFAEKAAAAAAISTVDRNTVAEEQQDKRAVYEQVRIRLTRAPHTAGPNIIIPPPGCSVPRTDRPRSS